MSYTWTTGEVITADKLNATGGDDYDLELEFSMYYDAETGLISNATGEGVGASFTELCNKLTSGEPLRVKTNSHHYTGTDLSGVNVTITEYTTYTVYDEYVPTPGTSLAWSNAENLTMTSTDMLYSGSAFSYAYDSTTKEYTITYTPGD